MRPYQFIKRFLFVACFKRDLTRFLKRHVAVNTFINECLLIYIFYSAEIMAVIGMTIHTALCKHLQIVALFLVYIMAGRTIEHH